MKFTIIWTYQGKNTPQVEFRSDELSPETALAITEDLLKTGKAKSITLLDHYNTTWQLKELKKYLQEMDTTPHNVTVYFDGGFDIGEKLSGLGIAIYYEQNGKKYRLRKNMKLEYLDSNNEAEYAALHFAIDELQNLDVHHQTVTIIGDSQVVINQMSGEWPVYEQNLASWADRIDEKLKRLNITPEFQLVPREQNGEADSLASQALKNIEITAKLEIEE